MTRRNRITRILAMMLLALSLATTAGATLPPTQPDQGPWACYRVFYNGWYYFIGWYWEDQTGKGWIERIQCFYRY